MSMVKINGLCAAIDKGSALGFSVIKGCQPQAGRHPHKYFEIDIYNYLCL